MKTKLLLLTLFALPTLAAPSLERQTSLKKTPTAANFDGVLAGPMSFCKRLVALGGMIGKPSTCKNDAEKIIRILGEGKRCNYPFTARQVTFPCLKFFRKSVLDYQKKHGGESPDFTIWHGGERINPEGLPVVELNKNLVPMIMGSLNYILVQQEKESLNSKTYIYVSDALLKTIMGEKDKNGRDNLGIYGLERKQLNAALSARAENSGYLHVKTKNILSLFAQLVYSTTETETGLTVNKDSNAVSEIYTEWLIAQLYEIATERHYNR